LIGDLIEFLLLHRHLGLDLKVHFDIHIIFLIYPIQQDPFFESFLTSNEITLLPIYTARLLFSSTDKVNCFLIKTKVPNLDLLSSR